MFDKSKYKYDPDFKSITDGKVRRWWGNRLSIWCPACQEDHTFMFNSGYPRADWDHFNENYTAPTFKPSMKVQRPGFCCHSFVTDGRIEFLGDCTHLLRGSTVDLPDYPKPKRLKQKRRRRGSKT